MNLIISGITECDLFSTSVVLRYRKDDNFKTFTSGCLSFIIIVLLAAFFISNIISFANKTNINFSEISTQSDDPTYFSSTTDQFLFAIGVRSILSKLQGIDLTSGSRYFNIEVTTVSVINGTQSNPVLNMQPCES